VCENERSFLRQEDSDEDSDEDADEDEDDEENDDGEPEKRSCSPSTGGAPGSAAGYADHFREHLAEHYLQRQRRDKLSAELDAHAAAYKQRLSEGGVSEEIQELVAEKKILPHQALQHVKYDELVSKEGVSEDIQEKVRSGTICKATAMQYVREGDLYAAGALTMPAQIQHLLDTRQIAQYEARGLARSIRSEAALLQRMAKMAAELCKNSPAWAQPPPVVVRARPCTRVPARAGIDTSFFGF
jgi:hypothetical protein